MREEPEEAALTAGVATYDANVRRMIHSSDVSVNANTPRMDVRGSSLMIVNPERNGDLDLRRVRETWEALRYEDVGSILASRYAIPLLLDAREQEWIGLVDVDATMRRMPLNDEALRDLRVMQGWERTRVRVVNRHGYVRPRDPLPPRYTTLENYSTETIGESRSSTIRQLRMASD